MLLIAAASPAAAAAAPAKEADAQMSDLFPARRQSQSSTEPGYVASPAITSIPGIGVAYGGAASIFNIAGTSASALGFAVTGDIEGYGFGALDIPMLWEPLSLTLYNTTLVKGAIEQNKRGIHSDPDRRVTIGFDRFMVNLSQFNLRFFEKRLPSLTRVISPAKKLRPRPGGRGLKGKLLCAVSYGFTRVRSP